jgi:predicted nucleic acid-binding protein
LIAACAEAHGAVVIHYDKDFDTIAAVTTQRVGWLVPQVSVA